MHPFSPGVGWDSVLLIDSVGKWNVKFFKLFKLEIIHSCSWNPEQQTVTVKCLKHSHRFWASPNFCFRLTHLFLPHLELMCPLTTRSLCPPANSISENWKIPNTIYKEIRIQSVEHDIWRLSRAQKEKREHNIPRIRDRERTKYVQFASVG